MIRNMRKLSANHIAFLRGMLNGVDPQRLWNSYMDLDGPSHDARLVRRVMTDIRDALSKIALRLGKPGTARLLRLDLHPPREESRPTLDVFAEEFGLEDASEEEQLAAYEAQYGAADKRLRARGRLIIRQMRAIDALVDAATESPKADDPVRAWLPEATAERLESAGIMTLYGLATRMQSAKHWWRQIPAIGAVKAERLQTWLTECGLLNQVREMTVASAPRAMLALSESGDNRREDSNLLGAPSDLHAVKAWLAGKTGHTLRAYRREAERMLLWAAVERQKPLSGITREDMLAYAQFLNDPQPADRWCAPRHIPRNNPAWRPFEGPLSATARDHALSILSGLFDFLVSTGYLKGNPAAHMPRQSRRSLRRQFGSRLLTPAQWSVLRSGVQEQSPRGLRLALILDLLYATGLRLSELAASRFRDLQPMLDEEGEDGWLLQVIGKGGKFREVPVPSPLVERAWALAQSRGVSCADRLDCPAFLIGPIAGVFGRGQFDPMAPAGAATIARDIGRHARHVADSIRDTAPQDAQRIEHLSAHWLRHTHASHALEAGVDLTGVQANLGHSNLSTTSLYVSAEQKRRMRQMRGFWNQA